MPSFKSLCPREVRLFEPISGFDRPPLQNSNMARNNWESWGGRGSDVIQSRHQNQHGYFSMQWLCFQNSFCSFLYENHRNSNWTHDKSMPASRCVVLDCNNSSNPRQGISLHNSPTSANVLSSWKRFVSLHRKNFNPTGRFVICSEHFTDDCFARSYHVGGAMKRLVQGAIPSVWKKNMKTIGSSSRDRRMVSVFVVYILSCHCCALTSAF